jgi:hypothetical protein
VGSATFDVFDGTGAPHLIELRFVKVPNANAWDWQAWPSDPAERSDQPLATGTITFDTRGITQTDLPLPEGELVLVPSSGSGASSTIEIQMDALRGFAQSTSLVVTVDTGAAATSTPVAQLHPATTRIELTGNLNPNLPTGAQIRRRVTFYDSLGAIHWVTVSVGLWSGSNQWWWAASTQDPTIITPNGLASGLITFASEGESPTSTGSGGLLLALNNGAADVEIPFSFSGLTAHAEPLVTRRWSVVATGSVSPRRGWDEPPAVAVSFADTAGQGHSVDLILDAQRASSALTVIYWKLEPRDSTIEPLEWNSARLMFDQGTLTNPDEVSRLFTVNPAESLVVGDATARFATECLIELELDPSGLTFSDTLTDAQVRVMELPAS